MKNLRVQIQKILFWAHYFWQKTWVQWMAGAALIPICIKLFLRSTWLGVGIAATTLDRWLIQPLIQRFELGQVSHFLLTCTLSLLLMLVAYEVAEVIVVLMTIAFVFEIGLLIRSLMRSLFKISKEEEIFLLQGTEVSEEHELLDLEPITV